jgi:hypothetical protein
VPIFVTPGDVRQRVRMHSTLYMHSRCRTTGSSGRHGRKPGGLKQRHGRWTAIVQLSDQLSSSLPPRYLLAFPVLFASASKHHVLGIIPLALSTQQILLGTVSAERIPECWATTHPQTMYIQLRPGCQPAVNCDIPALAIGRSVTWAAW